MVETLMTGPAYRIETGRLVLRCWEPADAHKLKEAIDASLDHLRPWMPWTDEEPQDVQIKINRLRRWRAQFDLNQDYVYGIFTPTEDRVLGGSGLHARLTGAAREIGYWVRAEAINKGYATEATAALVRVAFEIEKLDRVEIHCDPRNVRSASVPRKLGFQHDATLRKRLPFRGELRDTMIWSILKEEYPASPCAAVNIKAFDVIGRRIV